jgi:hypothetical protein
VKQLKMISNELTARFRDSISSTQVQNMMFSPPKSGANKAEWVSAVGDFFSLPWISAKKAVKTRPWNFAPSTIISTRNVI